MSDLTMIVQILAKVDRFDLMRHVPDPRLPPEETINARYKAVIVVGKAARVFYHDQISTLISVVHAVVTRSSDPTDPWSDPAGT